MIITGDSRKVLGEHLKPAGVPFLKKPSLELSEEKTKVTHIEDGFDFLGFNVRKYAGRLRIKSAKRSVKTFLADIRACIKSNKAAKTESLRWQLNPWISGWANSYRHFIAKQPFSYVDHRVFQVLCAWINRRHPHISPMEAPPVLSQPRAAHLGVLRINAE